jgi:hypothetical protein
VEVELRGIEERSEQIIAKYIAKLQTGTAISSFGDKLVLGGGGISNLELDHMVNTLKDEMKAYAERVVF